MRVVLSLGFRPFYLLATIFAATAMTLWMSMFFGGFQFSGYLDAVSWHSHEMLFGFVVAVIAGFLLTAVRNWTGLPTPAGWPLAALAGLWLCARILMLTGPAEIAATVDLLFIPTLAVIISIPIVQSQSVRNFKIIAVLTGLALANLSFHLAQLGFVPVAIANLSINLALDFIAILIAIMAGRIIPAFIQNAIKDAQPRQFFVLEVAAHGSLILLLLLDLLNYWSKVPGELWLGLFTISALSHFIRLLLWQPFKTGRDNLLWMLPLAYCWLPIALALQAANYLGVQISESLALHALTIGAVTSLMVAMMIRSARGHTGRDLHASKLEVGIFLLVQAAVITRIFPGIFWPQHYQYFVLGSAILWFIAFALFVIVYWPILTRPRIDGKPG